MNPVAFPRSSSPSPAPSAYRSVRRAAPIAALSATLLFIGACEACDTRECVAFDDCPTGQICNGDNKCVTQTPSPVTPNPTPNPSPNPTPTPTPTPNDGGVEPDVQEVVVQTQFPVGWLQPSLASPDTRYFVPHYEANGDTITVDEIREFDTGTERLGQVALFDFIDAIDGPCGIELIVDEPTFTNGETWVACADGLRIYYDFDQPAFFPGFVAHQGLKVTPRSASDNERRIWFARGGDVLYSLVSQPSQDGIYIPRQRDTIQDVTFTAVVDAFQLPNGNGVAGESILVVDRTDTALRLVPLQHDTGTNVLRAHASLTPKTLGENGHTAVIIGDVDVRSQANPNNVPNIMVFEPENGVARYYKMENGEEVLPPTIFETSAGYQSEAPEPSVRQIHVMSPDGSAVFYAIPGVPKVWRVPVAPGSDNLVTFYILNDASLDPSGIFPVSEQVAWVATSADRLLFKTTFQGTR